MGSVWVAQDAQLGREVAVKVMVPAAFALPDLVARFEREAKAAAQIRSAHVVQIFDHGFDGEQPFIVMELLDGEDLAARLRRATRLSLDETIRIVGDVCKALRSAHDIGVVHRDLKPANVFLAQQDDVEVVKVLDFGVAKLTGTEADKTNSHALLGTPHYMAPEQARDTGAPVDHRADLWALGVIAFRALTGQLPFPGESPVMVLVAVASQTAPAPSSIAPELGPEVDRFFAQALARDRQARFQSAQAFREALARLGTRASFADMRASRPSELELAAGDMSNETLPLGVFAQRARAASPAPSARPQAVDPTPGASPQRPSYVPLGTPEPRTVTALPAQPLSALRTTMPLVRPTPPVGATMPLSPVAQDGPARTITDPTPSGAQSLLDAASMPSPIRLSEPTPAPIASTGASSPSKPAERNWIAWIAGGAALVVTLVLTAAVLTRARTAPDGGEASGTTTSVSVAAAPGPARSSSDAVHPDASAGSTQAALTAEPTSAPTASSGAAPSAPTTSNSTGATGAPTTSSAPTKDGPAPTAVPTRPTGSIAKPTGTVAPTVGPKKSTTTDLDFQ